MAFWSQRRRRVPKTAIYKSIEVFKTELLGIGSYGTVYKARCDDLPCAAKMMHPSVFEMNTSRPFMIGRSSREHKLTYKKFEQEVEFMASMRHPNIVQYLGACQDPKSGHAVLVMELLDANLTSFLENAEGHVPFHIQVSYSHDIVKALSYLHSNGLIHRNLTSNNVLLLGEIRAKVTDFAMVRMQEESPSSTNEVTPKTDLYMPPEVVRDKPVYTDRMDIFSFGVLIVQMLTRKVPQPRKRLKTVHIDHPHFTTIQVNVSEIERRQSHINDIAPNHTLLAIALNCLQDKEMDRPSAQQLCSQMSDLKETQQYMESTRRVSTPAKPERKEEKMRESEALSESEFEREQESPDERTIEQEDLQHRYHRVRAIDELQQNHTQEMDILKRQHAQEVEKLQQQRLQQVKSLQQLLKTQYHDMQEKTKVISSQEEEIQKLKKQVSGQEWKTEENLVSVKLENHQLKQELETISNQCREKGKMLKERETQLERTHEEIELCEQEIEDLRTQLQKLEEVLSDESDTHTAL